jgi:hypothetical protein
MNGILFLASFFAAVPQEGFAFSSSQIGFKPSTDSAAATQLFVYRNSYRGDDRIDKDINNIFEQNRIWVDHVKSQDPHFFDKLGSGHNPKYLWIGA